MQTANEEACFIRNRIGPYRYISMDDVHTYPNGRKLRFVLYGAYDAAGLVGSEHNGIAILEKRIDRPGYDVVCDRICAAPSGYYGPTRLQVWLFQMLARILPWSSLTGIVNCNRNTRIKL